MTKKDLVVLVADKDMQYTLKGLLTRPQAMGIRPVTNDLLVHPLHDPACARPQGIEYLSHFAAQYDHGLLLFDHAGSGREKMSVPELQRETDERLASSWGERARAVVLEPELEAWVWVNSPNLDEVVGWSGKTTPLREWLAAKGYIKTPTSKPAHPKETFLLALREARTPRSASLYQQLAERVSLQGCKDRSFQRLCAILQEWFPAH